MIKYQVIYQKIKARITAGEYVSSQKLPEGRVLAAEFNCSELTVKKALDILVKEGTIVRKRGAGTFVTHSANTISNSHLYGTKYRYSHAGKTVSTEVINYSALPADENIARQLNCQPGELIYNLVRIRNIDGRPCIIEYTFMPTKVIPGLAIEHVRDSIYGYIREQLKYNIHSANMHISVVKPLPKETEYLNLTESDKLVNVEQTAYLDNGQLFEYSIARHLWSFFNFTTTYVRI